MPEQKVRVAPEQKVRVGKYATENGTTKAICHFSKVALNVKESTVRGWKTAYLRELASRIKAGDVDTTVE